MISFAQRRPILFSIVAVLLLVLLGALSTSLGRIASLPHLARQLVIEVVLCSYVALLLTNLKWWREAGFAQLASPRKLIRCAPLLFFPAIIATSSDFATANVLQIFLVAAYTFMVGFVEEGLMRGVVLRALLPKGWKKAVLLSSVLFGLGHLINILIGRPVSNTLIQVTYAALGGIGMCGARLYTGTIWPAVLLHFLIDFFSAATQGFVTHPIQPTTLGQASGPIIASGLFAIYGWQLLQSAERETGQSQSTIHDET